MAEASDRSDAGRPWEAGVDVDQSGFEEEELSDSSIPITLD